MEQKKILWIILSVALFLVVILGIGLIWFRPVTPGAPAVQGEGQTAEAAGAGFDAIEYIREGDGFPGIEKTEPGETQDFVAVAGEMVLGENPAAAEKIETPVLVDTAPRDTAVPAPAVPAAAPAPAAAPRTVTQPVSKPAPAAAPAARTPVTVKEYWIQAGAFESSSRATEAKEALTEKGFSPIISTRDVNGTTYFRVRLGPYANEAEAAKFLEWVKELQGFGSAWISQVTVTR